MTILYDQPKFAHKLLNFLTDIVIEFALAQLDPVSDMLHLSPDECREKAQNCIKICKGSKYILSAGCEVPAGVSDEVFSAFCKAPLF
jgi:uroporphyrinogen-III decarboxylase